MGLDNMFGITAEQMLGVPTIHLPINMIVQEADAATGKYWGVWQCQHPNTERLLFDSKKTHQLILADAFIRPQMALDSNEFRGRGIAGIATQAFHEVDKWNMIYKRM